MPQKLLVLDPAFAIPLGTEELFLIGAQAVIWGQIDFILDEILAHANSFDRDQSLQFLTDKQVGTKTDMLSKDYTRLPNKLHVDCKKFVEQINAVKGRRNNVFHGLWGWYSGQTGPIRQVAAFHRKTKDNPLKPAQLRRMVEEMIECSKTGGRVLSACMGFEFKPATQFIWGHDAPDGSPSPRLGIPPERLRKGRRPQDRKPRPRKPQPKADLS